MFTPRVAEAVGARVEVIISALAVRRAPCTPLSPYANFAALHYLNVTSSTYM